MSEVLNAIMYTDGGYLRNEVEDSVSGFGIHGYVYTNTPPKRGTGDSKVKPTDKGYEGPLDTKGKVVEGTPVTVVEYVDIISGMRGLQSSGHSELHCMLIALKWLATKDEVKSVILYCDNMLVVEGINKYLKTWKKTNFIRQNGSSVKYVEVWKEVNALLETLRETKTVEVLWVKGHNGHVGNEASDTLASKGLTYVKSLEFKDVINESVKILPGTGYWNPKVNVPRLLQSPRWYFDTVEREWTNKEGFKTFYVGCHGSKDKELELVGKPYSDNFLGVIKTRIEDGITDQFREYALKHKSAPHGRIVVGYLDNILSSKTYHDLTTYGLDYYGLNRKTIQVMNVDKLPMLIEMTPQGQGFRMMDIYKALDRRLEKLHKGSDEYQITDVTEQLLEMQEKKPIYKLMGKWTSQVKSFDAKVKVNLAKVSDPSKIIEKKVKVIFGQDILGRNQLAALAPEIETISLITWRESDQVSRYGTYITLTNGDHGLWSRYEANLILCN